MKQKLTMTADLKVSASDVSKSAASKTDNLPDGTADTRYSPGTRTIYGRNADGTHTVYGRNTDGIRTNCGRYTDGSTICFPSVYDEGAAVA